MYSIPQRRCKLVADGAKVRSPVETISSFLDAVILFRDYYDREALPHERVMAALVNNQNKIVALVRVAEGGCDGCALTPSDVLRPAIVAGARGIVLAHNHPSGDPDPSAADLAMTRALVAGCEAVGIAFLDHVIIAAGGKATSLREGGHIR